MWQTLHTRITNSLWAIFMIYCWVHTSTEHVHVQISHCFPYDILNVYLRIRQFWTQLPNDKPRANQLTQTGHPTIHRKPSGGCCRQKRENLYGDSLRSSVSVGNSQRSSI